MTFSLNPEEIIDHISTHGFYVIDDFLEPAHYQSLVHTAKQKHLNGAFKSAQIGQSMQMQENKSIRSDETYWIDAQTEDPAIQAYLERTKELAALLNRHLFIGLMEFETHFAAYPVGSAYKKHVDQFTHDLSRKISCVYYLNDEWQDAFGGALALYNKEGRLITHITPYGNRFICFDSELPHEVCVTHAPRYSITGWMKTRARSGLLSHGVIDLSQ